MPTSQQRAERRRARIKAASQKRMEMVSGNMDLDDFVAQAPGARPRGSRQGAQASISAPTLPASAYPPASQETQHSADPAPSTDTPHPPSIVPPLASPPPPTPGARWHPLALAGVELLHCAVLCLLALAHAAANLHCQALIQGPSPASPPPDADEADFAPIDAGTHGHAEADVAFDPADYADLQPACAVASLTVPLPWVHLRVPVLGALLVLRLGRWAWGTHTFACGSAARASHSLLPTQLAQVLPMLGLGQVGSSLQAVDTAVKLVLGVLGDLAVLAATGVVFEAILGGADSAASCIF